MRRLICTFVAALALGACGGDDDGGIIDAGAGTPDALERPDATDDVGPGEPTGFTATPSLTGPPDVALAWQAPAGAAGVLILRRLTALAQQPDDGTTYEVGDMLGTSEVVFVGDAEQYLDEAVFGGRSYRYSAFAYDAALRYSDAVVADARPHEYFRATVSIPLAGGALIVTPDADSGHFALSGSAVVDVGTATLELSLVNLTDRIAFNPKLAVTGAPVDVVFSDPDGDYLASPYRYFGPQSLPIESDPVIRQLIVTGVVAATELEIEMTIHPAVFISHEATPAVSLIDTGVHRSMFDLPADETGIQDNAWFSVLSPDQRFLYVSHHSANGVSVIDTTTLTRVREIDLAPEGDGVIDNVAPAELILSPDGSRLYVVASSPQASGTDEIIFLAELDPAAIEPELRRVAFGTVVTATSNTSARGLAVDFVAARAYVPIYGGSAMHVVNLTSFAAVDADGDAGNGVTPVVFTQQYPTGVLLHPTDARMYVQFGFGQGLEPTFAVVEMDRADLSTMTVIPDDSTLALSSTPNSYIGPDGRLWVTRNQYPSDAMDDADSFGISVVDIDANPVSVAQVSIVTSTDTGNNDLWDMSFVPGTTLAYATMADADSIFVFDYLTLAAVDIDGDVDNGVTTIDTGLSCYGGAQSITW